MMEIKYKTVTFSNQPGRLPRLEELSRTFCCSGMREHAHLVRLEPIYVNCVFNCYAPSMAVNCTSYGGDHDTTYAEIAFCPFCGEEIFALETECWRGEVVKEKSEVVQEREVIVERVR